MNFLLTDYKSFFNILRNQVQFIHENSIFEKNGLRIGERGVNCCTSINGILYLKWPNNNINKQFKFKNIFTWDIYLIFLDHTLNYCCHFYGKKYKNIEQQKHFYMNINCLIVLPAQHAFVNNICICSTNTIDIINRMSISHFLHHFIKQ